MHDSSALAVFSMQKLVKNAKDAEAEAYWQSTARDVRNCGKRRNWRELTVPPPPELELELLEDDEDIDEEVVVVVVVEEEEEEELLLLLLLLLTPEPTVTLDEPLLW